MAKNSSNNSANNSLLFPGFERSIDGGVNELQFFANSKNRQIAKVWYPCKKAAVFWFLGENCIKNLPTDNRVYVTANAYFIREILETGEDLQKFKFDPYPLKTFDKEGKCKEYHDINTEKFSFQVYDIGKADENPEFLTENKYIVWMNVKKLANALKNAVKLAKKNITKKSDYVLFTASNNSYTISATDTYTIFQEEISLENDSSHVQNGEPQDFAISIDSAKIVLDTIAKIKTGLIAIMGKEIGGRVGFYPLKKVYIAVDTTATDKSFLNCCKNLDDRFNGAKYSVTINDAQNFVQIIKEARCLSRLSKYGKEALITAQFDTDKYTVINQIKEGKNQYDKGALYAREVENEGQTTPVTIQFAPGKMIDLIRDKKGKITLIIDSRGATKMQGKKGAFQVNLTEFDKLSGAEKPIKIDHALINKSIEKQKREARIREAIRQEDTQRAQERAEQERREQERREQERREQERKAQERAEQERAEQERAEQERREQERREQERAEQERRAMISARAEDNAEKTLVTLDKLTLLRIEEIARKNAELKRLNYEIAQAKQQLDRIRKTAFNLNRGKVSLSVKSSNKTSLIYNKTKTAQSVPPVIKSKKTKKAVYVAANITLVTLIMGAITGLALLIF